VSRPTLSAALCAALMLIGSGPAATAAEGALTARADQCVKRVAFGLVEATTAGCVTSTAPGRWETGDAVTLNGLPLPVAPGTRLVLSEPTAQSPGGRLEVNTTIALAGITLHQGIVAVDLPAGGPGDERDVRTFNPADGQRLFGMPIDGTAALRFGIGADGRRYSLFRVVVRLPELFRSGPEPGAAGLTTTIGVRVDDRGVRADAVKVQVANAYIGRLLVKDLCLSYTAAGTTTTTPCSPPAFGAQPLLTCSTGTDVARWDGSALIVLPTESGTEVGVFAGMRGGAFSYAGAQVRNLGNAVPLAQGVYLDSVGLAICVDPPPLRFKGAAGIRFGPDFGGTQAALLQGEVEYVDSRPWVISARGELFLFNRRLAGGSIVYRSSGSVDLAFDARLDFTVASVDASVVGWLETRQPARFNVDGRGSVCVGGVACATGEVTVSTTGLAGCFSLADVPYWVLVKDGDWAWYAPWRVHWERRSWSVRAGLGQRWSPSRFDLMGSACDVGPYRAVRAAIASQSGERRLDLPNEPAVALRVEGTGAPPKVVVTGPDGRRIGSPTAAARIDEGSHVIVEDPREDVTHVVIARPEPGRWTIAPRRGSEITGLTKAQTLEHPTVVADVGFRRGRYVLAYAHAADRREITFVERSDGASEAKVIGRAAGGPCRGTENGPQDRDRPRCGRIRFTPGDGPPGTREIYAVVGEGGVAFDERLVARYDAGAVRPEPPQRLRLRRRGRSVIVRWRRAPGVEHYDVRVALGTGHRLLLRAAGGARRTVIPGVRRRTRVRVSVVAVDSELRYSAPARARLRPGRRRS
jgi:hypothetical protein